jgi:hypothetical protein
MDKITTRASNVSKHPGVVDGGGVKRKRRTKAEVQADKAKKIAEKDDIEKKKNATISRIAALEGQMEKQDAGAESRLKEGRRPQHSHKGAVVEHDDGGDSDALDSEFQPPPSELTPSDTYDEEIATPELIATPKLSATAKLKKAKPSVRQEIKLVNAKAGTEREQGKGKVRSLAYLMNTQ